MCYSAVGLASHQVVLAANWAEHVAGIASSAVEQVLLHVAFATRLWAHRTRFVRSSHVAHEKGKRALHVCAMQHSRSLHITQAA